LSDLLDDDRAPVRVLVVDDNPSNLVALDAVLSQPDVAVVRAASGSEALARMQEDDHAVVILDVQMPTMGGFEVARRIREEHAGRPTPIIFLTAFDVDPRLLRRAYASGAVDFVTKPFDEDILRAKVAVFVELYRKSREVMHRDELLATLGHELRNPLMSLLSVVEQLGRHEIADPALARVHGTIRRHAAHLHRLVEDALEVARFSQRKIGLRLERVDLGEIVQHAVELNQAAIDARGTDLRVALPPSPILVTGDRTRLAQVVGHLLDNATKFTPRGRPVSIDLCVDGAMAVVRVRDSGRGITPDHLRRIFRPFAQADSGDAARGGLGIGLALAKHLVELHGGTITATSEGTGQGAEFVVALPVDGTGSETGPETGSETGPPAATAASDAPAAAPIAAPARADTPRALVLVVDDNPEIRNTVQVFLEVEGHQVLTADCGRAALDQIARADPDVVLLDVRLPDLDGYAVASRVRAERGAARPRLIAMTGNPAPGERDRALRVGFDAHLRKPIDGRTLLRAINGS